MRTTFSGCIQKKRERLSWKRKINCPIPMIKLSKTIETLILRELLKFNNFIYLYFILFIQIYLLNFFIWQLFKFQKLIIFNINRPV